MSEPGPGPGRRRLDRDDVPTQFLWYLAVGGTAFLADLIAFSALLRLGLPLLPVTALGFAVGTAVNYLLSRCWAFSGGRYARREELLRFVTVALVGLLLTLVLVWALVAAGMAALPARLIAVGLVLAWNYAGRRWFVFHRQMPESTWRLSSQALERWSGPGRSDGP